MQGATITVTYRVSVSNIGDVDNLYSYLKYAIYSPIKYPGDPDTIPDWYNKLTGNNISASESGDLVGFLMKTIPMEVTKLYSYYDNLMFRAEDNSKMPVDGLSVQTPTDNSSVSRYSDPTSGPVTGELIYGSSAKLDTTTGTLPSTKWDKVEETDATKNLSNNNMFMKNSKSISPRDLLFGSSYNADNQTGEYSIVETQSLGSIKLYPNKSMEVQGDVSKGIPGGQASTVQTYLQLSKTLSSQDVDVQDILNYSNFAEIVGAYSITGRRDYNGHEGTFAGASYFTKSTALDSNGNPAGGERDTDAAEKIIILPPFGDDKWRIPYAILGGCVVILAGGIIFIKRKIL